MGSERRDPRADAVARADYLDGQAGLRVLGERLLSDSPRIVARMHDRIVAEVVAYGGGAVPTSVLRRACEQNASLIYGSLGQPAVLAMPQSHADGADRAARGV